jgi:hypothetical protein
MAGSTPEYFKNGGNFAVGAMRALNNSAYKTVTGLDSTLPDYSLGIQLQSFKNLLPIIAQGSSTYTFSMFYPIQIELDILNAHEYVSCIKNIGELEYN